MNRIFLDQRNRQNGSTYYVVTKLVNSVRYIVGERLSRDIVQSLCAHGAWTVTIVEGSK